MGEMYTQNISEEKETGDQKNGPHTAMAFSVSQQQ